MRSLSPRNKPRKPPTVAEINQLADLARQLASATLDPEWLEIKRTYSIPELIEMVRKAESKPKRAKGRPPTPRRNEILDAAAKAKAEGRPYTPLAARFNLTPKQLTDLVERNRRYFKTKIREFRASK